jgi:hypothetical protein
MTASMTTAPIAATFLALIFRNADGTFTFVSWIFGAGALLMIAAGIWCLVAPESYVERMIVNQPLRAPFIRRRSNSPREGRWWAFQTSRGFVRLAGALGVALGVAVMTWVVLFSLPGRFY